jgi:predicted RNase H-like nuclease
MRKRVLGVDACKAGWVGIALTVARTGSDTGCVTASDTDSDTDSDTGSEPITAFVAPTIGNLISQVETAGPLAAIGIDIPIGLAEGRLRQCDLLAREAAGPRRSSVFVTPVRATLGYPDFAGAVALNRSLTGIGFSIQAYGLKAKILEVDAFVAASSTRFGDVRGDVHIVEVHPELSFAAMAGAPLADSKTTWAGMQRRRRLLAAEGVNVDDLDLTGDASRRSGVDDLLDAAAVAWTARRLVLGIAISRPDPPEILDDGWPTAIWS